MKNSVKARELLQLIDKKKFSDLCHKWDMDKGVRKLTTWNHVCGLLVAYLLKLDSLREVEQVLGIPKSTLSDANCRRCSGFYEELCQVILTSLKHQIRDRKIKKAIGSLLSLDASVCSVHGSLASNWAWKAKSSDGNKASVGFHAVLNVNMELIEDFRVEPNKIVEGSVARQFELVRGSIYIFDRGYRQLGFWWKIIEQGSDFVTRMTDSRNRRSLREKIIQSSKGKAGVLFDGEFYPSKTALSQNPEVPKKTRFRHIVYRDPVSGKVFDFITSNFKLLAQEIADIYKKRWSVELLFRWLKGHLNIRYIPSRNKNSVKVQLAVAVLLQILIRFYLLKNQITDISSWDLLRSIRTEVLKKAASLVVKGGNPCKPTAQRTFKKLYSSS